MVMESTSKRQSNYLTASRATNSESTHGRISGFKLSSARLTLPPIDNTIQQLTNPGRRRLGTETGDEPALHELVLKANRRQESNPRAAPSTTRAPDDFSQHDFRETREADKNRKAEVPVKHVEKGPIAFPKAYTVLPPINNNLYEEKQNVRIAKNRKRSDDIHKVSHMRRPSEKRYSKKFSAASLQITFEGSEPPAPNTVDDLSETDVVIETEIHSNRHEIEPQEIHEELMSFLKCDESRRRNAVCALLDENLIHAADIIRDMLLRQTMEELCMMW
ncbi:uncharacterized protein LOC116618572 [Nematostella vectensis]|uniref:uncharacterized protein LOC116618572 n=1 Tax=Nematostella vectensis TaxID=45351 RepID=UPI0020771F1B|nr:uncharacterized protein LOC116618572 [Nematostella vectensis]